MDKPAFIPEPDAPLKLCGFDAITIQNVYVLTRELDENLELSLEADGYVQQTSIVLSDGRIVDGWVRI